MKKFIAYFIILSFYVSLVYDITFVELHPSPSYSSLLSFIYMIGLLYYSFFDVFYEEEMKKIEREQDKYILKKYKWLI